MAHTTEIDGYVFIHDGDFTGIVTIKPDAGDGNQVDIPMGALEAFVAEKHRAEAIAQLEQADPADVFRMVAAIRGR